jgi:transposase
MFIRKNKNRSGSVSVQIISKEHGKYRVVESIGSGKTQEEIARLYLEAQIHLHQRQFPNQQSLFVYPDELQIKNFVENLSNRQIHTIGPELVFGTLFDNIGFNAIKSTLFRHIVIARLAYPTSKLKTVDYLYRYRGVHMDVVDVYRFLDTLNTTYKEKVERIAYEYTKNTLKGNITVVFYDMTTLYFEAEDEDDLRKIGFSKDGKFQKPQIMLGLLVGEEGLPIGYDIFKGNTFEGHTLLPTLKKIQQKYSFSKPIVIADAALLSKDNLENLGQADYQFIIGARIKNESDKIKKNILIKARVMKDRDSLIIRKKDKTRLVVTYSDKRAAKDAHNRERGLRKLRRKVRTGKLTKEHINNRGYNKFLSLTGEVSVEIDESKIAEDKQWDGLKGYVTNTNLRAKSIVRNYGHLWQIEKAFRISKTDLKVRPIFHYRQRRIGAHICIAFAAYTIYKELERLLKKEKIEMSPKRAGELTHNMYEIEFTLPKSKKKEKIILKMDEEQTVLMDIVRKYAKP